MYGICIYWKKQPYETPRKMCDLPPPPLPVPAYRRKKKERKCGVRGTEMWRPTLRLIEY